MPSKKKIRMFIEKKKKKKRKGKKRQIKKSTQPGLEPTTFRLERNNVKIQLIHIKYMYIFY